MKSIFKIRCFEINIRLLSNLPVIEYYMGHYDLYLDLMWYILFTERLNLPHKVIEKFPVSFWIVEKYFKGTLKFSNIEYSSNFVHDFLIVKSVFNIFKFMVYITRNVCTFRMDCPVFLTSFTKPVMTSVASGHLWVSKHSRSNSHIFCHILFSSWSFPFPVSNGFAAKRSFYFR